MAGNGHTYKVIFLNQGQVYEIYARHVGQGGIFGFVEVEELVFGDRAKMVIEPGEERLRTEFEGVKRTHIPLHSVVRIDEVERPGTARVSTSESTGGTVAPFPVAVPSAAKDPTKS